MKTTALFFRDGNETPGLDLLMDACREERCEILDQGALSDAEGLRSALPDEPFILFLPAVEEDCLGVKLAREALMDGPPRVFTGPPRVIVLYAPSLPSKEFLCLAFREGVDDVTALESGKETLAIQVARARRLLQTRLDSSFAGGELEGKLSAMRVHCEHLERDSVRWKERFMSLASTSFRMATGELRLTDSAPSLLIVAASNSQAASVEDLANSLGFDPVVVHNGMDALKQLEKHPPQVILTDGILPDMDAAILAHSARRVLGEHPVVIIGWSSNPAAQDILLAPEASIDDFVLKSSTGEAVNLLAAALLGALR